MACLLLCLDFSIWPDTRSEQSLRSTCGGPTVATFQGLASKQRLSATERMHSSLPSMFSQRTQVSWFCCHHSFLTHMSFSRGYTQPRKALASAHQFALQTCVAVHYCRNSELTSVCAIRVGPRASANRRLGLPVSHCSCLHQDLDFWSGFQRLLQ